MDTCLSGDFFHDEVGLGMNWTLHMFPSKHNCQLVGGEFIRWFYSLAVFINSSVTTWISSVFQPGVQQVLMTLSFALPDHALDDETK